jgi:DNA-binding MarR family transcriptional regulator
VKGPVPVRRGEAHSRAKLSVDEVVAMRARYRQGGVSQAALAKQYGISSQQVSKILRGERWDNWPSPEAIAP